MLALTSIGWFRVHGHYLSLVVGVAFERFGYMESREAEIGLPQRI